MARHIKNYCDHFPHSIGMRNHRKIKALKAQCGIVGYAIWCMILEYLTGSDGNVWENTETELVLLSGDFGVSVTEIRDVRDFCIRMELLFEKDGFINSPSLDFKLQPVYEKRKVAKQQSERQNRSNGKYVTENNVSVTEKTLDDTSCDRMTANRIGEDSIGEDSIGLNTISPPNSKEPAAAVENSEEKKSTEEIEQAAAAAMFLFDKNLDQKFVTEQSHELAVAYFHKPIKNLNKLAISWLKNHQPNFIKKTALPKKPLPSTPKEIVGYELNFEKTKIHFTDDSWRDLTDREKKLAKNHQLKLCEIIKN